METAVVSQLPSKLNEEYSSNQPLDSYISKEHQFESVLQRLSEKNYENCPAIYSTDLQILYTQKDIRNFIESQFNSHEFNIHWQRSYRYSFSKWHRT